MLSMTGASLVAQEVDDEHGGASTNRVKRSYLSAAYQLDGLAARNFVTGQLRVLCWGWCARNRGTSFEFWCLKKRNAALSKQAHKSQQVSRQLWLISTPSVCFRASHHSLKPAGYLTLCRFLYHRLASRRGGCCISQPALSRGSRPSCPARLISAV